MESKLSGGGVPLKEPSKRFLCVIDGCDANVSRKDHLYRHIRLVHKSDPQQIMGSEFKKRSNATIGGGPTFKCTYDGCDTALSRKDHVLRHIRTVHLKNRGKILGSKGNISVGGSSSLSEASLSELALQDVRKPAGQSRCDDSTDRSSGTHIQDKDDHQKSRSKCHQDVELDELEFQDANSDNELVACKMEVDETDRSCVEDSEVDEPLCILCNHSIDLDEASQSHCASQLQKLLSEILSPGQMTFGSLDDFSVCSICLKLAESAAEKKLDVDEMETTVRKLQNLILHEMRKLKRRVTDYYQEMWKIRSVISSNNSLEGNGRRGLALQLQVGIMSVISQLQIANKELEAKLLGDRQSGKKQSIVITIRRKENETDGSPCTEDDNGGSLRESGGDDCAELADNMDFEDLREATCIKRVAQRSYTFRHRSTSQISDQSTHQDEEVEVPVESDDDDDEDFNADAYGDSEDDASQCSESEKNTAGDASNKGRRKRLRTNPIIDVDLTNWSEFKIKLLKATRRQYMKGRCSRKSPPTSAKSTASTIEDPRLKWPLEYNPDTDQFNIGDVSIHVDESDESLECSKCKFRVSDKTVHPQRWSTLCMIQTHIQREHLSIFQCSECPSKLGSYKRYAEHMSRHKKKFLCQKCDKAFSTELSLHAHKRSKHMNKDRKKRNGKATSPPV